MLLLCCLFHTHALEQAEDLMNEKLAHCYSLLGVTASTPKNLIRSS